MSRKAQLALYAAAALAANPDCEVHEEPEPYVLPEGIPDHLSMSYGSRFFYGGISSMIGVEVDGHLVGNVHEYCVSEGWYKVRPALRSPLSDKLHSDSIRPFWRQKPSRQVLKRLRREAAN